MKRSSRGARKPNAKRVRRIMRRRPLGISRSPTSQAISIRRTNYWGTWNFGTAATTDYWRYWEPTVNNGFNNFSEFANVFDRYRVNGIRMEFRPKFDTLAGPTTGATPMIVVMPQITYVIDPQTTLSASGLYTSSSLNALLENGGKTVSATRPVTLYFRPQISVPTNIGSGVIYRKAPYLATTNNLVPHRGVHVFLHQNGMNTATQDIGYDVFITWYVTFKNLR